MKDWPKSPRASHSRIASSTSQSLAFTRLRAELIQHCAIDVAEANGAQGGEFMRDVLELARALEVLGLYFEDGDLIHQFADRDRHQDVSRHHVSESAHALASAFARAHSATHADDVARCVILRCRSAGGQNIGACAVVRAGLQPWDGRK